MSGEGRCDWKSDDNFDGTKSCTNRVHAEFTLLQLLNLPTYSLTRDTVASSLAIELLFFSQRSVDLSVRH